MLKKKSIFLPYFQFNSHFGFLPGDSKFAWVPVIGKCSHPMTVS